MNEDCWSFYLCFEGFIEVLIDLTQILDFYAIVVIFGNYGGVLVFLFGFILFWVNFVAILVIVDGFRWYLFGFFGFINVILGHYTIGIRIHFFIFPMIDSKLLIATIEWFFINLILYDRFLVEFDDFLLLIGIFLVFANLSIFLNCLENLNTEVGSLLQLFVKIHLNLLMIIIWVIL